MFNDLLLIVWPKPDCSLKIVLGDIKNMKPAKEKFPNDDSF